jgi:anti-sigma-K factor RskA
MKLARSRHLDALIGAYLIGSLRGGARRRLEQALRDEPRVASRLAYFQRVFALRYTKDIEVKPSAQVWSRLDQSLQLARFRAPWWRRAVFLRGWAAAATAALVVALGVRLVDLQPAAPRFTQVAVLSSTAAGGTANIAAELSADGRSLRLVSERPIEAGAAQSYELWLLPPGGGKPESMAVLGRLDTSVALAPTYHGRVSAGAKLAVSVEPAGGSPTGAPTGPVILVGEVKT